MTDLVRGPDPERYYGATGVPGVDFPIYEDGNNLYCEVCGEPILDLLYVTDYSIRHAEHDLLYDAAANAYHADVEINDRRFRLYVFPDGQSDDDPAHPWGVSIFDLTAGDGVPPVSPWTTPPTDTLHYQGGHRTKEDAYATAHHYAAYHLSQGDSHA